tara:strand:- start:386 stop:616 length:231 start_codon:yes stop_codon:yes gene_type:complete
VKYVIILYLCSFINAEPVCYSERIVGLEFNNYYDCILDGYKQSHNHLATLEKEKIIKDKLAIRFQCKEINIEKKDV